MNNNKLINWHAFKNTCVILFACMFVMSSCGENGDNDKEGGAYDPGKPVVIESFSPLEGGMATRMLISGSNLGNDPSKIKVYFNDKEAAIIGCDKGKALVVTPRQPGDTCTISVVIGNDSVIAPEKFIYHISTTVITLVGQKGTNELKTGSFAEATFMNPSTLTVDNEYNIFLSHWRGNYDIVMINQQDRTVTKMFSGDPTGAPSTDTEGKVVMFPSDGGDVMYVLDPAAQWGVRRRQILHPSAEEQGTGMKDFTINWKHGFAACKLDDMIYTRSYGGQIIKFNPKTRVGELVADGIEPDTDSFLSFDPVNTHMLYISYTSRHCIFTFNILTKEHKLFAGTKNTSGWKDGSTDEALFTNPCQLIFDVNNNIVLADAGNHCIRQITPAGRVSTLIGIAGKSGYQDGNPDDALFNYPKGVAIDKDYNIYIADFNNNCVRKLAVE
ncbi:IPT/TIG domain-containing protein [uncultured Proteiniphilum sp.]|uniref:IPT/TIG domain-containing protein n=1 Tax=uncultured Proteiniphilum sp. TaxID=497637 RepID=UPI002605498C|nr:IPT/TIG domain-containing protein [uncultured Proteiniphilum sp.]